MNEVAKYNEGEWFLEHSWYLDDFGLKRNAMGVYKIHEKGLKEIYPFFAPIRVSEFKVNENYVGDDISPFQTYEYSEMLRAMVEKITK